MKGPSRTLASLLISIFFPLPAVGGGLWRALDYLPGQKSVTVMVSENPRIYYRITSSTPLAVDIQGPARLKIVSRAEAVTGAPRTVAYRVILTEGSRIVKEQSTESSVATEASIQGGEAAVCKSRTFTWQVPDGGHRIKLTATGAASVLVRLQVANPQRPEGAMVSLTPVAASRSVTVSEGEKLIPYYSVLPGKPVRLRVVGPTSLELSSRLDFDSTMRGTQAYRLTISEDGQRLREVEFKTTKATTATYTDLKDRIASKIDRVVITVAQGSHEILVELSKPRNGSAEIHARIPQPTVATEE